MFNECVNLYIRVFTLMIYKHTAQCSGATQSERNCSTFETAVGGFEAGIDAIIPNTTAQHVAIFGVEFGATLYKVCYFVFCGKQWPCFFLGTSACQMNNI